MEIVITGRTPSKKNSKIMVCRGKFPMLLPSAKYKEWHKDAIIQLAQQKVPKDKLNKPIKITTTFYAPDKRVFDLSNKIESIHDLLVDYGFLEDDNYTILKEVVTIYGGLDRKNPRAEIKIEDI